MRRHAVIPLAAAALLFVVVPALSQSQQRPGQLSPPGGQLSPPGGQLSPPGGQLPPPQRGQQQQQQQPQQPPQAAPAKPYQPVAIRPPAPMNDPSLDAFRNQISEIAQRKDRAALAKLVVAKDFFWLGEKGDMADKKRPGIDSLTRAMMLNAQDGSGWDVLAGYAADPTGMPLPEKKDTFCSPADPVFEIKDLETLAQATGTDEMEWGYPIQPGVEVRASAQPNAPVIEKLGMHFVRVMEDDASGTPADAQMPMMRIATPSGKVGYIAADALSPLGNDQLCYVKEATGWKIAGYIGGEQ